MALLRRRSDDISKNLQYLVRTRDVEGLESCLLDTESKGAHCRLAIEGLFRIDSPEAWDTIGRVLIESETALVEMILTELDVMATPQAMKATAEALGNRNVFIRGTAVRVLSQHETGVTLPALLRATRDPEKSISRMAARTILRRIEKSPALMSQVHDATCEGILSLMDDRWAMELLSPSFPPNVRKLAAARLGSIGGDEATQALASVAQADRTDLAEVCWRALESSPHVADYVLLPLLVDPRPAVKSRAIELYARFSDDTASDLVAGMARDGAPEVRCAALRSLSRLTREGAIPTIELALQDPEESVRLQAMDLLCAIRESTPELVRAVLSQTGELKRRALVCLANRGVMTNDLYASYIEFLFKGSSCTDLAQREYLDGLAAVAKTLGQSGTVEALLALTALARSVIRRMRRSAIEGLMSFPPADRADALASLVDTYDTDVLKNVGFGLHEAADPRAVMPLVRCVMECRGRSMVKAKAVIVEYKQITDVDWLISCLTEKWASVRRFAAEKLRHLKDPKSVPALLAASQDEDVEVQLAVFEALGPFAGEQEEVTKRMLEALSYGDISVRQAVCEALGEARCKEAVPELVRALHNVFLRPRARDAIKRIGDRKGYLALKRLEIRAKMFPKKSEAAKRTTHSKSGRKTA